MLKHQGAISSLQKLKIQSVSLKSITWVLMTYSLRGIDWGGEGTKPRGTTVQHFASTVNHLKKKKKK